MGHADVAKAGLALAIARFPEREELLQWLARGDPGFRSLCEDYGLARESLARFEALTDAAERPEIADYRVLVVELEDEIGRFLGAGPGG